MAVYLKRLLCKFLCCYLSRLAASPLASRGFAPRNDQKNFFAEICKKDLGNLLHKKKTKEIFCKKKDQGNLLQKKNGGGFFYFLGGWGVPPPKKIA